MWSARITNTNNGARVGLFHAGELIANYPANDWHLWKCEHAARWLNDVARRAAWTAMPSATAGARLVGVGAA